MKRKEFDVDIRGSVQPVAAGDGGVALDIVTEALQDVSRKRGWRFRGSLAATERPPDFENPPPLAKVN